MLGRYRVTCGLAFAVVTLAWTGCVLGLLTAGNAADSVRTTNNRYHYRWSAHSCRCRLADTPKAANPRADSIHKRARSAISSTTTVTIRKPSAIVIFISAFSLSLGSIAVSEIIDIFSTSGSTTSSADVLRVSQPRPVMSAARLLK